VYELQKFDSDSERRFAVMLEKKTSGVLNWCRPRSKPQRLGARTQRSTN
jgi:hypothetical protein